MTTGDQLLPDAATSAEETVETADILAEVTQHGGTALDSEIHNEPIAGQLAPQAGVAVVGVDHRRAFGLQALEDLSLGARDGFDRAQELDMRRAGIIDERNVRCCQAR